MHLRLLSGGGELPNNQSFKAPEKGELGTCRGACSVSKPSTGVPVLGSLVDLGCVGYTTCEEPACVCHTQKQRKPINS